MGKSQSTLFASIVPDYSYENHPEEYDNDPSQSTAALRRGIETASSVTRKSGLQSQLRQRIYTPMKGQSMFAIDDSIQTRPSGFRDVIHFLYPKNKREGHRVTNPSSDDAKVWVITILDGLDSKTFRKEFQSEIGLYKGNRPREQIIINLVEVTKTHGQLYNVKRADIQYVISTIIKDDAFFFSPKWKEGYICFRIAYSSSPITRSTVTTMIEEIILSSDLPNPELRCILFVVL
jgi:hypothetical protein